MLLKCTNFDFTGSLLPAYALPCETLTEARKGSIPFEKRPSPFLDSRESGHLAENAVFSNKTGLSLGLQAKRVW
jgi:hypothetical protein